MTAASGAPVPRASRRRFLEGATGLALVACLPGTSALAAVPAATRTRGSARVDVREHGARGDGASDDTAAFQAAIDALPYGGGTVHVPAGAYLIDPLRSVRLRSRMHLSLAADARLLAKANPAPQAYVLLAERLRDLEISGGAIVGDRDSHQGKTGEWGHGIRVRGCERVTIRDIHISRCWGDAISAGGIQLKGQPSRPGRDLLIVGLTSTGNRRQGLTIGSYRGVLVSHCEFSGTGGTPPGAGIDVEPDTDVASGVVIEDCRIHDNRGPGVQLYRRATDVTIRRCLIERNRGGAVLAEAVSNCTIADNLIRDNKPNRVLVRGGSRDIRLTGNQLEERPAAKKDG